MNRNFKTCVVTDLDDTIWDWLNMWYNSFYPYFNDIRSAYSIEEGVLKADFKALHQKYNTTEVSFAFQELTTLSDENKSNITVKPKGGKSIYHRYNSNKKNNLSLYPGVLETLKELKSKGVLIIGFTESNAFFTKYRIKHLGLDGLFDCIYTPLDTGVPESVNQKYSDDYWETKKTEIRYLSKTIKKPDSEILGIILKDFGVTTDEAIYIGDKIDRDIRMAIDAGVTSVYAQYGSEIEGHKYQLLKDVTHWTDEDVSREIEFQQKHKNEEISPNFTLKKSFSEILNLFDFTSYQYKLDREILPLYKELIPNVISVWSDIVKVQQHFNDIALRIRNLSLTAFTFIIAALGFTIKENITICFKSFAMKLETVIAICGAIIIWCFMFMDKNWYHKYLIGASKQASFIETKWHRLVPEMGLSNSITTESNYKFHIIPLWKWSKFPISINSTKRFKFFYYPMILVLIVFFISSFFFKSNVSLHKENEKLKNSNITLQKQLHTNERLVDSLEATIKLKVSATPKR